MLNRLPPRLHWFLRSMFFAALGFLAGVGALAIYSGDADGTNWWLLIPFSIGAALAAIFREVPSHILRAHQQAIGEP